MTEELAARLGWTRAGFGDYVRSEVRRRGGDPTSRQTLQDVGQSLVDAGAERFCRDVLRSGNFLPGENFLLDGVRHVEIYNALKLVAQPSITKLVLLDAEYASRRKRSIGRSLDLDFERAESHRVESEVKIGIPEIADAIVDGNRLFSEVLEECVAAIHGWQ